ncbi:Hsp20/alpha crystallin family protein [Albibacterium indicum]|uniref:Hsp20/alpha crystallin family protein n=1 Tax=Albibacterium indicum TaxID=2292082 RepID=UPI000E54C4E7|nr:Hsp20/alpha crystallin family protein [Pedobacter indicus]
MTLTKSLQRNHSVDPWLNDVFDSFFNDNGLRRSFFSKTPSVNISEKDNGFEVELATPGLKKEDFSISIEKDILTISAEKKEEKEVEDKKYSKREFNYTSFSRSFTLPENIDEESIDAKYENGILSISLTKKENTDTKKMIAIS